MFYKNLDSQKDPFVYNPALDDFGKHQNALISANKDLLELNLKHIFDTLNFDPSRNNIFLVETPDKNKQ